MKVLITGGTGFLGRHLVWRLAAEGVEVVFTGRRREAADTVCRLSPARVRWQSIEHGISAAAGTLASCADGADAIVHCAALSSPWGSFADFRRSNIDSTAEVLAACRAAAVPRLVHVSTPSLYFGFRDRLGIREDEPLPAPANEYVRSKAEAERLVIRDSFAETVILRPRALFGPWDETLMPRLLRVLRRGPIPLMRGGRALLDMTCVENAVDALRLAISKPVPERIVTYNVSNGEPVEVATLLEKITRNFEMPLRTRRLPWSLVKGIACVSEISARMSGGEPALTRYGAGVLAFSQTLDISAIRRDLGYVPRVTLDEGLGRHAEWWRAHSRGDAS